MSDNSVNFSLEEFIEGGIYPGWIVGNVYGKGAGDLIEVISPIDGKHLAEFTNASSEQVDQVVDRCNNAFKQWRSVPAPQRGELVRCIGNQFRQHKQALAKFITLEVGKINQEALGEVQEVIDVCDFAVGLSRQLHGLTIATERPSHRMMEQWLPLGSVGVITAFNFPMAVWAWNAMLALVCGDSVVWKPSEKTPLSALACHKVVQLALADFPEFPQDLSAIVIGTADVGQQLAEDMRLPLVSATGSVPMGRKVAQTVAARLGRSLLELGGNNAMIITPSADLELALRAVVFAAVGTAGQRCTSLRRLIVHHSLIEEFTKRLQKSYASLLIGDPRKEEILLGPLNSETAFNKMQAAIKIAQDQGGELLFGGERITEDVPDGGAYVRPAIMRIDASAAILQEETFAPLLYVIEYQDLEQGLEIHNAVPQGLSSAIFTENMREAELFVSAVGSDCGIANVNIGTSGAEIGGAFGGEKDTGGGRESGSDAWKNYMRRVTNTINYGKELPLAQGIRFDVD